MLVAPAVSDSSELPEASTQTSVSTVQSTTDATGDTQTQPAPAASTSRPVSQPILDKKALNTEVSTALLNWAEAWSQQDIDAYLSSYTEDYTPIESDHNSWRAARRERVLAPQFINVSVHDAQVEILSADRAIVNFIQSYHSSTFRDSVRKLIVMQHDAMGWRIEREHVIQ